MASFAADDRVLVTGATGFIGGAAARALVAMGANVHSTSASGRAGPPDVTVHRCDLLDTGAVTTLISALRPTHLLHAAWDVTHGAYWTSPLNFSWLAAGAHLLQAFVAQGGRRAVGVGSCAEYAWTQDRYAEARSSLACASPYGRCKLAMGEAFAAAELMGVSTAWARLFFPYGPGDNPKRFLPSMLRKLMAGEAFEATAGTQIRDFIHIDDVGQALAMLTAGEVKGPVNICSGEGVTLRDMAFAVAEALAVDRAMLGLGALPARPGEPAVLIGVADRLLNEVGFRPAMDWRRGVRNLVETARSQGRRMA